MIVRDIEKKVGSSINIAWKPQARQAVMMACPATEVFFGGAKGGGKSDALLGDFAAHALREGDIARGIIFRRSYSELEELIQRSEEIYPLVGARYAKGEKKWFFPNGATLKMRFAEYPKDAAKYQGHNYSWVGIDEAGNYATPFLLDQMLSCLRSAGGAHCQIRLTGNPGGPGHAWLKRRYIDGMKADHIYTYPQTVYNPIKKEYITVDLSRCFIPSFVWDNQILVENDPAYLARLQALPEHLRKAYLDGDWDIFIGQIFAEMNKREHFVDPYMLPWDWPRFASLDWGYVKPYSVGIWTLAPDGQLIRIHEIYGCIPGMENEGMKQDAKTVSTQVAPILTQMGISRVYADSAMWQHHGNQFTIAELWEQGGVSLTPSRKDRKAGLQLVHSMLQQRTEAGEPMLKIFNTCTDFWRTMTSLVVDKTNPEDIDSTGEDHIFDEVKYAVLSPEVQRLAGNSRRRLSKHNYLEGDDRDYAR